MEALLVANGLKSAKTEAKASVFPPMPPSHSSNVHLYSKRVYIELMRLEPSHRLAQYIGNVKICVIVLRNPMAIVLNLKTTQGFLLLLGQSVDIT